MPTYLILLAIWVGGLAVCFTVWDHYYASRSSDFFDGEGMYFALICWPVAFPLWLIHVVTKWVMEKID